MYFQIIFDSFSKLKIISEDLRDTSGRKSIFILHEIFNLRGLAKKIEHTYYPNIVFAELSLFFYSVLAFRDFYDLITQKYLSFIISLILGTWSTINTLLQIYLMHLNEETERKVSDNYKYNKYIII